MCDAGYKAQRFLVKRPHPLDFISRKRRPVGIPKQVFRKLAKIYVSATHRNEYTKFSGTWIYFPLNYHFHSFKNSFIF